MNLNHTYGILNTAELIVAHPKQWHNDFLQTFLNAAHRFTGGRTKDVHPILQRAVARAIDKIQSPIKYL